MTTKLDKALEALKRIANGSSITNWPIYATKVHAEITAPPMEEVEVKRYMCVNEKGLQSTNITEYPQPPALGEILIELTGTYQRPIPKPEVVELEGIIKIREESGTGRLIPSVQFKRTEQARKHLNKRVTVRVEGER